MSEYTIKEVNKIMNDCMHSRSYNNMIKSYNNEDYDNVLFNLHLIKNKVWNNLQDNERLTNDEREMMYCMITEEIEDMID